MRLVGVGFCRAPVRSVAALVTSIMGLVLCGQGRAVAKRRFMRREHIARAGG